MPSWLLLLCLSSCLASVPSWFLLLCISMFFFSAFFVIISMSLYVFLQCLLCYYFYVSLISSVLSMFLLICLSSCFIFSIFYVIASCLVSLPFRFLLLCFCFSTFGIGTSVSSILPFNPLPFGFLSLFVSFKLLHFVFCCPPR